MRNKFMLAGLLAASLFAFAPMAKAQTYGTNGAFGLSTLAGQSATNIITSVGVIDFTKQQNLAVAFLFTGDAAGTANATAAFSPSIDGTTNTMDNTKVFPLITPAAGTARQCVTTNFPASVLAGYGYLHLRYVSNAAASVNITNIAILYGIKRNAP